MKRVATSNLRGYMTHVKKGGAIADGKFAIVCYIAKDSLSRKNTAHVAEMGFKSSEGIAMILAIGIFNYKRIAVVSQDLSGKRDNHA